jgi:ADP-ribose pyrophosphatase
VRTKLTKHQIEALDAYEALRIKRPDLFSGRISRPIIRDREVLEAYAVEHDVVLGIAADTPYVLLIVDLVESRLPGGGTKRHPYLRFLSRAQLDGGVNVVVFATIENPSLGAKGSIVLVDQDRHALGTCETELPRGFGDSRLSGEVNALHELESETGYTGDHAYLLGTTITDSGLSDAEVSFYHVPVVRSTVARHEAEEAISKVHLATPQRLWQGIQSGKIRDGFTLQAYALYSMHSKLSGAGE